MNNIKLMYLISFLQGLVFYAPVSVLFRIERGLSVTEFFFLDFLMMITIVILEVPWGYFADKYGYKKTLIISYVLFFIGRVMLLFSNSFFMFLLQAITCAVGVAGYSGCDIAYLYESCDGENKEEVFGRYRMYASLAFFTSSIISFLVLRISMEFAVILTIVAYGLSVIVILFTKDSKEYMNNVNDVKKVKLKDSFKDIGLLKYILLFVISITIISEVSYGIGINVGQIHLESLGFDIVYLGIVSCLAELVGMLASKIHIVTKKFGQLNTLKFILFIMLINVATLIFSESIFISIISISLLSGLMTIIYPIIEDIKNKNIEDNRATILSMYSMIGNTIASSVSMSIGILIDINLKYDFLGYFVIMFIGICGVFKYVKKAKV